MPKRRCKYSVFEIAEKVELFGIDEALDQIAPEAIADDTLSQLWMHAQLARKRVEEYIERKTTGDDTK